MLKPAFPDQSAGLFVRLQRMDMISLFLAGFIVLYAVVSLTLEHVVGIIGFAKTPYLNAGGYFYSLVFLAGCLVLNKAPLRILALHPFAILMVSSLFVSVLIGISNDNAKPYIIAWTVYILAGILVFHLFRYKPVKSGEAKRAIDGLYSLPFLTLMLTAAFLSIFSKDNHYQYMLFEAMALYGILVRKSLIEKAASALLFLMLHLGSNDGFVEVEVNRASILAICLVGLAYMLYRKYLIVLVFVILAAAGGLLYALSLDDDTIETLPRNIKEAILLMKGDDIYNHTSSYQRVYEGQKVMEDFRGATDTELLFGKGLGRTVDMTGAQDKTVGQHALLGALEVHNIHFIHFAVLHKFGIAGLTLLALLIGGVFWMFVTDLSLGRLNDGLMFFYFYIFYDLMFAMPASNFLIANPIWAAFLGMLCHMRAAARPYPIPEPAKRHTMQGAI